MGRLVVLGCLCTLVACIEPNQLRCGDRLCATGSVCLPDGTCASHSAVIACDGLADGAACTTPLFTGACMYGACAPTVCGDGRVTGNEQCDGPATGVDCVTYGFDLGLPQCNANCDLDLIAGCTRFGWRRLVSGVINSAWADTMRLAWVSGTDFHVEVHTGSAVSIESGNWDQVTGNATTHQVVAWGIRGLAIFDGTTWTYDDGPPSPVDEVVVADDGTLYTADLGGACEIQRKSPSGTWTPIRQTNDNCHDLALDETGAVLVAMGLAGGSGGVDRWDGTSWTPVMTTINAALVVYAQPGTLWVGTEFGGLDRKRGAVIDHFLGISYIVFITEVGPYVYAGDFNATNRFDGDIVERVPEPISGPTFSDGTRLFVHGNGIYEYSGVAYSARAGLTAGIRDIQVLPDRTPVVATEYQLAFPLDDFGWAGTGGSLTSRSIAGSDASHIYATDGNELDFYDGNNFTAVTPPGFTNIRRLWMDGSTLYAVGDGGLTLVYTTTWSTIAPASAGCDLHGIAGNATGIYAVGACGTTGVAWKLAGSAWTEVMRAGPPLEAVTVASDGDVIAAGPAGGARMHGGVWLDEPAAVGISISSTTGDDVWVAGGPDNVLNWDGHVWSRLAVEAPTSPHVFATPSAVYLAGVRDSVLLR